MSASGNSDHKGLLILFLVFLAIGGLLKHRFAPLHRAPADAAAPAKSAEIPPAPAVAAQANPAQPVRTAAASSKTPVTLRTEPAPPPIDVYPRPVATWLEAQIELARRGISSGAIDGVAGSQTVAALRAFQESEGLSATGELDPDTRDRLLLSTPPLTRMSLTAVDLASLQTLSPTWLGKSQQTSLAYENALDMVSERTHAHPGLIRQLNPGVDWNTITPSTSLSVPAVSIVDIQGKAALIHIGLGDHVLEIRDAEGNLLAHFPVSIARDVTKRPAGELHVTVVIPDPDYTFDPEVFPESEEARELGRKLIIPPGPRNPVGIAWIGLDRQGYGIHGTPWPELVGRTESHGCFRLANWDARTLLGLAWVGLPVVVEP